MNTKIKRARRGDVLEIVAPDGFIYIQFIGRHPELGHAILVCPVLQSRPISDPKNLFVDGYVTFYPVEAAVYQRLARVVGHLDPPEVPTRLRRAGARVDRKVLTWVIEDGSSEFVTEKLTEAQRRLPIASIWNHEFLIHRVLSGWRPELVG